MTETIKTTMQLKLLPTKEYRQFIQNSMNDYIATVNDIVADFRAQDKTDKRTSKDIKANLPSCLKNQAISDAKSIFKKYKKACREAERWNKKHQDVKPKEAACPVLHKPACIWNNQNYSIRDSEIAFPVWINGKSTKIHVKASIPGKHLKKLQNSKKGTLRITPKGNKLIAQIAIENETISDESTGIMGVDLGIKIPAVCVTDTGKVRFSGNGRKNKYLKRKFRAKRKHLGKAKKLNAIRKNQNKEQRIMRDIDHKISREIINFAKNNHVAVIRMEQLTNIRATARTSRKNEKNLHTWSFYRLARYIEYKAALAGIRVEYVNPAYTSQICPVCGKHNHAKDRKYQCSCGFHGHRDIVGAVNIRNAVPVADGNSLPA